MTSNPCEQALQAAHDIDEALFRAERLSSIRADMTDMCPGLDRPGEQVEFLNKLGALNHATDVQLSSARAMLSELIIYLQAAQTKPKDLSAPSSSRNKPTGKVAEKAPA